MSDKKFYAIVEDVATKPGIWGLFFFLDSGEVKEDYHLGGFASSMIDLAKALEHAFTKADLQNQKHLASGTVDLETIMAVFNKLPPSYRYEALALILLGERLERIEEVYREMGWM